MRKEDLLRKEDLYLFNIHHVQTLLYARKMALKAGEPDPFLPSDATEYNVKIAEEIAQILEECVKESKKKYFKEED